MTIPDTVIVLMAGWHVDDGDREARVGATWTVTLELQRAHATPEDWWPRVVKADRGAAERIEKVGDRDGLPVYRFVARAAACDETETGVWTALQAGPLAFAAPGKYSGMVEGEGHLAYDTYMVEGEQVFDLVRQDFRVERIQRLEGRYERQDALHGHWRLSAYGEPHDVVRTHATLPAEPMPGSVMFLLHCQLPER